jgi:hypothetical protein
MLRSTRIALAAGAAVAALGGAGGVAYAHAFGQRYDLPLPLGLYLAGAAAVVTATFLLLARFRAGAPGDVNRLSRPRLRGAIPVLALLPLRAFGVCGLALIVAAGFFGNQNPFKNFAPTAVWVVWWVGTAYLSAFIGNVWPLLNPWTAAVDALRALKRHRVEPRPGLLRYPQWLGIWPAVALFLLFAWAELVWEGRDVPHNVAAGAALYSILTWLGFWVFGRDAWLRGGEAFSVFFAMLGRFAPLRLERADGRWLWTLRPYAVGLLTLRPLHVSEMVFVLTMLATVTTDGFLETPLWANAVEYLLRPENRAEIPEHQGYFAIATVAVCAAPALFSTVYLGVAGLMAWTAAPMGAAEIACLFVLSLVPIAIAYHLAHYLSFLLLAGQFIVPLVGDPFGWGWDLFGTALYRIDIGIVDTRSIWYTALIAIVVGHVLAVWLAHETAFAVLPDAGAARRGQYPMIVLMVAYTALSLWILAQPIVEPK